MTAYKRFATRLLMQHEGKRAEPYLCSAGKWTWGIGRNLEDNPLDVDEVVYVLANLDDPNAIAEYLLGRDIDRAIETLKIMSWWNTLNDARKAALIDFVFNIGFAKFLQFKKTIQAIAAGDFDRAADEMVDSAWYKQVGKRSVTISEIIRTGEMSCFNSLARSSQGA